MRHAPLWTCLHSVCPHGCFSAASGSCHLRSACELRLSPGDQKGRANTTHAALVAPGFLVHSVLIGIDGIFLQFLCSQLMYTCRVLNTPLCACLSLTSGSVSESTYQTSRQSEGPLHFCNPQGCQQACRQGAALAWSYHKECPPLVPLPSHKQLCPL